MYFRGAIIFQNHSHTSCHARKQAGSRCRQKLVSPSQAGPEIGTLSPFCTHLPSDTRGHERCHAYCTCTCDTHSLCPVCFRNNHPFSPPKPAHCCMRSSRSHRREDTRSNKLGIHLSIVDLPPPAAGGARFCNCRKGPAKLSMHPPRGSACWLLTVAEGFSEG